MIPLHQRRIQAAYEHFVDLIEEQGEVTLGQAIRHIPVQDKYERAGLRLALKTLYPRHVRTH